MEHAMQGDKFWLARLSRRGWAWEFLRRLPDYRGAYVKDGSADGAPWGLLRIEDPSLDARKAEVFWRAEDCIDVLPMSVCTNGAFTGQLALHLDGLVCRTSILRDDKSDRADILFSQEGRFLQLAIFGGYNLDGARLVVPALADPKVLGARTAALRRLNDLLLHKTMRPVLYPTESRASRLTVVLAALDGALAGLSHREIGANIFSESRVKREWSRGQDHMRDQVRRAVAAGQALMNGGYRQFLRPTTGRSDPRMRVPRAEPADGLS